MPAKILAISLVAALTTAWPARADLIMDFLKVPSMNPTIAQINSAVAANPKGINSATMTGIGAANSIFIMVSLWDTSVGNATDPPANNAVGLPRTSIPATTTFPDPRWYSPESDDPSSPNTDQAMGLIQHFTRIQPVANIGQTTNQSHIYNPFPPPEPTQEPNFSNLRLVGGNSLPMAFISGGSIPPLFSDFGGLSTSYGITPNWYFGNFLSPRGNFNGRIPLFVMRLEANGFGTETIRLFDRTPSPDFQVFLLGGSSGNPNHFIPLDPVIFSASHPNFNLTVTVVPEPSSMALVGLALVGLGYRLRRHWRAGTARSRLHRTAEGSIQQPGPCGTRLALFL